MREAGLRLIGTNLMTGDPFDEPIRLEEDFDPTCGYYYWGSFLPNNCVKDPWTLDLEITGRDAGAHYTGRQASGDELDAEPATKAYVDANTVPTYPWKDYKPGADKNHTITIAPLKWYGLEVTPTSLTVLRRASVSLRVKQKTWDCRWEERFGPVSCPVTWKIETKLWKVRLVGDNLPPGEARLEIEPDRRRCPPGNYTIEVTCSLGPYSQTVVISVDVL